MLVIYIQRPRRLQSWVDEDGLPSAAVTVVEEDSSWPQTIPWLSQGMPWLAWGAEDEYPGTPIAFGLDEDGTAPWRPSWPGIVVQAWRVDDDTVPFFGLDENGAVPWQPAWPRAVVRAWYVDDDTAPAQAFGLDEDGAVPWRPWAVVPQAYIFRGAEEEYPQPPAPLGIDDGDTWELLQAFQIPPLRDVLAGIALLTMAQDGADRVPPIAVSYTTVVLYRVLMTQPKLLNVEESRPDAGNCTP